ncbi:MAG TPA: sulfatase, partial [Candidatus Latescibacteria bacterium]|nr:sulfatase [Candidatus Latescibacterota bacterium]
PQIHGAPGDPERAVFAEGGYDTHEPHCFEGKTDDGVCGDPNSIYYPKGMQQQDHPESVCRSVMIRTATHKLIHRTNGRHELYDMQGDFADLNNIYNQSAVHDIRHTLEQRLLDWYLHTSDVVPWTPDPRGFPTSAFP